MSPTSATPEGAFRANRMIVWALAAGVLLFAGVVSFMEPISAHFEPVFAGLDVLALVAFFLTAQALALSFFLPPRMVAAVAGGEEKKRIAVYCASRLVAAAMCEAPALLWCVAMLLGGAKWYLGPVALLVVAIVMHAPTRDGFEAATGVRLSGLET